MREKKNLTSTMRNEIQVNLKNKITSMQEFFKAKKKSVLAIKEKFIKRKNNDL